MPHPFFTTRQTASGTKARSGLTLLSMESQFLHPLMIQDSEVVHSSSLKWMDLGALPWSSHFFCTAGGAVAAAAVWHEIYGDIIRGEEGRRRA